MRGCLGDGFCEVAGESDGGNCVGRSESDDERNPAGEFTERGVEEGAEDGGFAAAVWEASNDCAVAERAEEGVDAGNQPDEEHGVGGADHVENGSGGGEDS